MKKINKSKRIVIEITITLVLWGTIILIPAAEYDLNYALMFYGFIFSIICFFGFVWYWIKNRKAWKSWIIEAIIYTLFSSPITFGYIVWNIQELFDIYLKG